MPMTWALCRKLYLQATGDTPDSREEAFIHLAHGQRRVANTPGIDVPEVYETIQAVIPSGSDSIPIANLGVDVFAIASAYNQTQGMPVYPEPSGMIGRQQFLQPDTSIPPAGQVTHYMRDGQQIFFRNTPDEDTTITFRVMIQMPDVSEADLNDYPLVPEQYRMALVQCAAASYFSMHSDQNSVMGPNGQPVGLNSSRFEQQAQMSLAQPKLMRAEEDRPRMQTMRLAGYSVGPRSMR